MQKSKHTVRVGVALVVFKKPSRSFIPTGMFKSLGTWLGLESPTLEKTSGDTENLIVEQEEKVVEAQNEVNKQQPADMDGEPEANQDKDNPGKGLGGEHKTLPFYIL